LPTTLEVWGAGSFSLATFSSTRLIGATTEDEIVAKMGVASFILEKSLTVNEMPFNIKFNAVPTQSPLSSNTGLETRSDKRPDYFLEFRKRLIFMGEEKCDDLQLAKNDILSKIEYLARYLLREYALSPLFHCDKP